MSTVTERTPTVRIIKTRPGPARPNPTTAYSELLRTVRSAGLLGRRRGYYLTLFSIDVAGLVACGILVALLGDSPFQLLVAVAVGVLVTQIGFLSHEATHGQVFASARANRLAGFVVMTGIVGVSNSWWNNKHSRHHQNPNVVGKDPDIEPDFIVFQEADAAKEPWIKTLVIRRQGYWFFPLLLLEGLNLQRLGVAYLLDRRRRADHRVAEFALLAARIVAFPLAMFLVLPPALAAGFVLIQMAVFGLYMGATFAPNHKGMPQLAPDAPVDFLRRQVLTSRNVRGGRFVTHLMGGLNYQIEHHLFPNMARPFFPQARRMVRAYCAEHDIPYTETSLWTSYGIVIAYLNRVGLAAGDPFECPLVATFRHR